MKLQSQSQYSILVCPYGVLSFIKIGIDVVDGHHGFKLNPDAVLKKGIFHLAPNYDNAVLFNSAGEAYCDNVCLDSLRSVESLLLYKQNDDMFEFISNNKVYDYKRYKVITFDLGDILREGLKHITLDFKKT